MRGCRFLEAELQDMDRVLAGRYVFLNDLFLLVAIFSCPSLENRLHRHF